MARLKSVDATGIAFPIQPHTCIFRVGVWNRRGKKTPPGEFPSRVPTPPDFGLPGKRFDDDALNMQITPPLQHASALEQVSLFGGDSVSESPAPVSFRDFSLTSLRVLTTRRLQCQRNCAPEWTTSLANDITTFEPVHRRLIASRLYPGSWKVALRRWNRRKDPNQHTYSGSIPPSREILEWFAA
ncbi:predicted protein [Coccidioides posadasii str. Silveira]|uniref:Predicted protein n=1 Tax=Coccidioides posadasii (strain RMSCC 757 / Silveira) TaxID=443226 RepID=E9CXM6_COCPS|nr:predicted protein [Coccidioides posadasii str. Silveira]